MLLSAEEAKKSTLLVPALLSQRVGVLQRGDSALYMHECCWGPDRIAWRWAEPKKLAERRRGYCGACGEVKYAD